ncbi:MAG TPA: flavodoxin domain-containing protein [Nakamurella sp.]|nr:flavodoxin domain-containing protein [Nakamurella sp.]
MSARLGIVVPVVTSTFGDGGPPDDAADFWGRPSADDAPSLVGARFAVLGYGDSSCDDFARKVDRGQNRVPERELDHCYTSV